MSQGKSSRGAKRGAAGGRSTASRAMPAQQRRGVYIQQPKSDVFVVLLGVALGAMLLGCLLLALKLNQFGFDVKGPGGI